MLKKFVFVMAIGGLITLASCGDDEEEEPICLICTKINLVICEGDDNGVGGTYSLADLEACRDALAHVVNCVIR